MFIDNSLQSVKDLILSKQSARRVPILDHSEEHIYVENLVKCLNNDLKDYYLEFYFPGDLSLAVSLHSHERAKDNNYIFTIFYLWKLNNGLVQTSLKNNIHGSHSATRPISFEKAKKIINKQLKFHFKQYL